MATEQKLSDKELQSIQQIRQSNQQLLIEFGKIEISERQLEERKRQVDNQYIELKNKEKELLNSLESKYKNGTVDLDKGVYIPSEDSQKEPQIKTSFD